MDDVALISDNREDMGKMLLITQEMASRYRIEFGKEKSKTMCIAVKNHNPFNLGQQQLDICRKYKYLGRVMDQDNKGKEHINEVKCKAEGALQTILAIAGNPDLKGIEMKIMWQLLEACIMPIITYTTETIFNNSTFEKEISRILDNLIKRILMVPVTTPTDIIYAEVGIMNTTRNMYMKKINMLKRIKTKGSEMLKDIIESENNTWRKEVEKILKTINTNLDASKRMIKNKIIEKWEN